MKNLDRAGSPTSSTVLLRNLYPALRILALSLLELASAGYVRKCCNCAFFLAVWPRAGVSLNNCSIMPYSSRWSAAGLTWYAFSEPVIFGVYVNIPIYVILYLRPGPISCTTFTLWPDSCHRHMQSYYPLQRAHGFDQSLNPMMSMQQGNWKVKKIRMK